MTTLETEIRTFEEKRAELEEHHFGKFVVIVGDKVIGTWDTIDAAATEAVKQFGRGPYLIRQIGEKPLTLPASVFAFPIREPHAHS